MKRALLPAIIITSLSITACSSATIPTKAPTNVTPPPSASDTKAPAPETPPVAVDPAPTQTQTATAPAHQAPAGSTVANPPAKIDPKPVIKWYPRGIGLPLTSDDPAAEGKKVVLLTFDDGPTDQGSTEKVLDTLAAENVKAMFFITGYGMRHRHLVERIHKEGHVLGPHTNTHANLAKLNEAGIREELDPVVKVIEEVTGKKPKWLRPPYGAYNQRVIDVAKSAYGMDVLNWTDGSLDWEGTKDGYKDPNLVIKDTMDQLHRGAVVLLHDTLKHTAEALPTIIKQMKAEGYEFVVLD